MSGWTSSAADGERGPGAAGAVVAEPPASGTLGRTKSRPAAAAGPGAATAAASREAMAPMRADMGANSSVRAAGHVPVPGTGTSPIVAA